MKSANLNNSENYLNSFLRKEKLNSTVEKKLFKAKLRQDDTWKDMLKRINFVSSSMLIITPLIALYGFFFVEKVWATMVWTMIYYFWTGMGITGGYHRLFSHKAYKATLPVKLFLLAGGTGAVQGSCRWWSRNHRIHHRFTDTAKDPYNAKEGFFYSHFGWMLFKPDYSLINKNDYDISDLDNDKWMVWQHDYYPFLGIFMGFVFPTMVAGLGWGDWMGGYFFAAVARLVFVHHATFFVNSLAHWIGEQPFADRETPKDHFLTAFLTLGEGYHNFHHEFPQDYRNAIKFYQYDPTKWMIKGLNYFGLTYDLKTFGSNEIKMGKWQMRMKNLMKEKKSLSNYEEEELPIITKDKFLELVAEDAKLIILEDFVVDIENFINHHPGGTFIEKYVGKDATVDFKYLHNHSAAALMLTSSKRIAELKPE